MNSSPAPLLSLCMIVKDEEDFLPDCLASARGLVDEIVVYDTGSRDATVAIAEAAGAMVHHGYWDDDFGRARNAALDLCSGQWVLQLDADERARFTRKDLRRAIDDARRRSADGVLVPIDNIGVAGGGYQHAAARLFRRESGRWVGRLHEQVMRLDGEPMVCTRFDAGVIEHLGYVPETWAERDKTARNIELSAAAVAEATDDDDRALLLLHHARSLNLAQRFEESYEICRQARDLPEAVGRASHRSVLRLGAEVALELGRLSEAVDWLDAFRAADGDPDIAAFLRGCVELRRGGDVTALADMAGLDDLVGSDNMGINRRKLHHESALALVASERWSEAVPALLRVIETQTDRQLWGEVARAAVRGELVGQLVDAVPEARLRQLLAALVLEPGEVAEPVAVALRDRFPDDPRLVAFAVRHAPRLDDVEAIVTWATVVRNADMADQCPLLAYARDVVHPVVDRFFAAVCAHAAFRDPVARTVLDRLVDQLRPEDEPAAIHVLESIAPDLIAS